MSDPSRGMRIRRYEPDDLPEIQALLDRVVPYRPEDQAEVQSMVARAAEAERIGDRWAPLAPAAGSFDAIEESYLAFWVAVTTEHADTADVVGMVGMRRARADTTEAASLPMSSDWQRRGDVAELCCLRVAPERWRQGIGARLTETVIHWSRENGYRTLVLNTTSPQLPARALSRRLGFREIARSYLGPYELVWFEYSL